VENNLAGRNVRDCHVWINHLILPAASECGLCAKGTDELVPCFVCDSAVCLACCNTATYERFFETGIAETICNACIPPQAYADEAGETTKFFGDRKCGYCIVCQDYHEQYLQISYADCDIGIHENSPLARLCIESRAKIITKPESSAGSSSISEHETIVGEGQVNAPVSSNSAGRIAAKEIKRDNLLLSLQVEMREMEKRLSLQFEKSLNLKIREIRESCGLQETFENQEVSRDRSSQTSVEDLNRAKILYQKYKAQVNPTQAILESLPGLMERIASSLEYQNNNFQQSSSKRNHNKNSREAQHDITPVKTNQNRNKKSRKQTSQNAGNRD